VKGKERGMGEQRAHKNLITWKKSMELVTEIYKLTQQFPKEELFGLTAQIRKSVVSIPSNIAEGLTRKSKKDKVHFLNIADGSLSELDTQIEIALRLGYLDTGHYNKIIEKISEIQRLISGLIRKISD